MSLGNAGSWTCAQLTLKCCQLASQSAWSSFHHYQQYWSDCPHVTADTWSLSIPGAQGSSSLFPFAHLWLLQFLPSCQSFRLTLLWITHKPFFFFFVCLFALLGLRDLSSLTRDWLNLRPCQWKSRVLTPGLPGNSPHSPFFFWISFFLLIYEKPCITYINPFSILVTANTVLVCRLLALTVMAVNRNCYFWCS